MKNNLAGVKHCTFIFAFIFFSFFHVSSESVAQVGPTGVVGGTGTSASQRFVGPDQIGLESSTVCGGNGFFIADCPAGTTLSSDATKCTPISLPSQDYNTIACTSNGTTSIVRTITYSPKPNSCILAQAFTASNLTGAPVPQCPGGYDRVYILDPNHAASVNPSSPIVLTQDQFLPACAYAYVPSGWEGQINRVTGPNLYFTSKNRRCITPPPITGYNIDECSTTGATCAITFKSWTPDPRGAVVGHFSVNYDSGYLCDKSTFGASTTSLHFGCYAPNGNLLAREGETFYIHDNAPCDWTKKPSITSYSISVAVDWDSSQVSTPLGVSCPDLCIAHRDPSHACGRTFLASDPVMPPGATFYPGNQDYCVCLYRKADHTYAYDNKQNAICASGAPGAYTVLSGPDSCGMTPTPTPAPTSTPRPSGGLGMTNMNGNSAINSGTIGGPARACNSSEWSSALGPCSGVLSCCEVSGSVITYKCSSGKIQTIPGSTTGLHVGGPGIGFTLDDPGFVAGACSGPPAPSTAGLRMTSPTTLPLKTNTSVNSSVPPKVTK